jgi:hypothetical protein
VRTDLDLAMWDWNGVMECGLDCCILRNGKTRRNDTNTSVCGHFLEGFWTKRIRVMMVLWIFF